MIIGAWEFLKSVAKNNPIGMLVITALTIPAGIVIYQSWGLSNKTVIIGIVVFFVLAVALLALSSAQTEFAKTHQKAISNLIRLCLVLFGAQAILCFTALNFSWPPALCEFMGLNEVKVGTGGGTGGTGQTGSGQGSPTESPKSAQANTIVVPAVLKVQAPKTVDLSLKDTVKETGWEDLRSPFIVETMTLDYEQVGLAPARAGLNRVGTTEVKADVLGTLRAVADPSGGQRLQFVASKQAESGQLFVTCVVSDGAGVKFEMRVNALVSSEKPLPIEVSDLREWCDVNVTEARFEVKPTDLLRNELAVQGVRSVSERGGRCEFDAVRAQVKYTPKAEFQGEDTITYTVRDNWNQKTEGRILVRVGPANLLKLKPESETRTAEGVREVLIKESLAPGKTRMVEFFDAAWATEFDLGILHDETIPQPSPNALNIKGLETAQSIRFEIRHSGSKKPVCGGILKIEPVD